jgi:predicted RNase H-like nuclease (RuvC/YqgF family)
LKAARELINELQEEKGDVEGELNESRRRFNELDTVHKQVIEHVKDLDSQLADRGREINRLQGIQATVLVKLAVTQEKAKAASIRNEIDEKQAMVVSLQLSLKNEKEVGRVLEEHLARSRGDKEMGAGG